MPFSQLPEEDHQSVIEMFYHCIYIVAHGNLIKQECAMLPETLAIP